MLGSITLKQRFSTLTAMVMLILGLAGALVVPAVTKLTTTQQYHFMACSGMNTPPCEGMTHNG